MNSSDTHDQRWRSIAVSVGVLGFAVVGGWRWWWQPRANAAEQAATAALEQARAAAITRGLAIEFDADPGAPLELAWRAPGECVEVYRVRVDEQFRDPSVAVFVGREEQHTTWALALTGRPGARHAGVVGVEGLLISLDDPGGAAPEPEPEPERRRQLWWSARTVGPAAPDFACRQRSWDPLEDALALGWPELPDHPVRVGQSWQGGAVEGRCHETTCVDDQGQFPHDRPCRARAWRETAVGAGQISGEDGPPAPFVLIQGDWDDGHDLARPEIGILTSRQLLIAEGRPLWARVRIEQRWVGVTRELELTRLDDCGDPSPGLSDDLSDEGSDDRSVVTQIRARLRLPPT
ncbi:hypothetical protein DB30_04189 [Enhygromyxa salina]|uniref:Uncharacterized protein n=1 Tax=Enhygromyxa salina TaxID=215803 RepID=A0A0C2D0I2_9BACT|nr:hypothetical protein [Enhygromyxa salina]KIG16716.1 hypothetical protein DB30_04189 [Enhygromyxa salina]